MAYGNSLPTNQEVPGEIPTYAIGLFSSEGLLNGMYGKDICAFQCPLSTFFLVLSSKEVLELC